MNSFQWIEIIAILAVIGYQLYSFGKTFRLSEAFREIFPEPEKFRILRYTIAKTVLARGGANLVDNLARYHQISEDGQVNPDHVELEVISKTEGGNAVTDSILQSLNTYLVRNKGVASDFHLIKDVVERNCDAVEEEISQAVSMPLYIGLLGTFMGIIIGLLQMSGVDTGSPEELDKAVSLLLVGVEIAMCASFFGLLLTVVNSFRFKKNKAVLEQRKNGFYTFLQTELLPLLNQSINSSLFSFQNSLFRFNADFTENITRLHRIVGKNYDALIAQEKVLSKLETMDIMSFAKANVSILQSLQVSVERLSTFNKYLLHSNDLAHQSGLVAERINGVLERTGDLGNVAKQVLGVFEENKQMTAFLQSHYNSLDQSHQLINKAVVEVSHTLHESLEQLKSFTQEQIQEIHKITTKELSLMSEQYPERWKNLDSLAHLEKVSKDVAEMKMSTAGQIERLSNQIKEIRGIAEKFNVVFDSHEVRSSWFSKFVEKIKNFK